MFPPQKKGAGDVLDMTINNTNQFNVGISEHVCTCMDTGAWNPLAWAEFSEAFQAEQKVGELLYMIPET